MAVCGGLHPPITAPTQHTHAVALSLHTPGTQPSGHWQLTDAVAVLVSSHVAAVTEDKRICLISLVVVAHTAEHAVHGVVLHLAKAIAKEGFLL